MPSFLGHQIADDAESVVARNDSATGFIPSDEPLLESLRIIKKGKSGKEVNTSLLKNAQEIRDFLAWVSGPKRVPLPPLVRRILCLQRALLVASEAHTNTSSQLRTGVRKKLEAIDGILSLDGVKNPNDPQLCEIQGAKFAPGSVKMGSVASSTEDQDKSVRTERGRCDQTEVVKLLMDIKRAIGQLQSVAPSGTSQKLNALRRNIMLLSSIDKADPGSLAVSTLNQMMDPGINDEEYEQLRSTLQFELSRTYLLTQSQAALLRTGIETLALQRPEHGNAETLRRLDSIKIVPDIDLKPLLDALAAVAPQLSPELLAKLSAAKTPADIRDNLDMIRETVNASGIALGGVREQIDIAVKLIEKQLAQFDARFSAIQTLLDSIQDQVGHVRAIKEMIEQFRTYFGEGDMLTRLDELRDAITSSRGAAQADVMRELDQIKTLLVGHTGETADITRQLTQLRTDLAGAIASIRAVPTNFDAIVERITQHTRETLDTLLAPIHAKLNAIHDNTAAIQEQTADLPAGVGSLQTQMTELTRKIEAMQGNVTAIRASIGEGFSERMATITRTIEGLEALIAATHGPEGPYSRVLENINDALAELQVHNAGAVADADLVRTLAELRDRIAAQSSLVASRDASLAERDATIRGLQDEKRAVEQQLRELQTSPNRNRGPVSALQAELNARKEREASLNARVTELTSRIRDLETEHARVGAAARDSAARNDGLIKALQAEIAALKTVRDELRGREAVLRGSLDQSRGTVESLTAQLAAAEAARAELEASDAEQIAEKDAIIRDLRGQLGGLDRLAELERQLTDYELKLKTCTQAREELERNQAMIADQYKKNSGVKNARIEELSTELETMRARAAQELSQRNLEYKAMLAGEQKKQQAEYAASIADMEEAMKEEIEAERAKAVAAGQKQKETIEQLRAQLSAQEEAQAEAVEREVAERDRRIIALTDRIREIQNAQNERALRNDSEALRTQRAAWNTERGELNDELARLRERVAEAERTSARLTEERAALQARVDDCEEAVAAPAPAPAPLVPEEEAFPKVPDSPTKYQVDLPDDHIIYNINNRVWIGDGLRKIFYGGRLATDSTVPEAARQAAFALLSQFLTHTPDVTVLERNNNVLFGYDQLRDVVYNVDGRETTYDRTGTHSPSETIFASIGMLTYIFNRAKEPEFRAPYTAVAPAPVPRPPPVVSNVRGSAQARVTAPLNATRRYGRGTGAFGSARLPQAPGGKPRRKTRKHRR